MNHKTTCASGFTTVELLTVVGIISLILGISVPAMNGLGSAQSLSNGAALLAGWLNAARSEAISRHTVVRFVVARQWDHRAESSLRRICLQAWNDESQSYYAITDWRELPVGVVLEPGIPDYLAGGAYAKLDPAVARGDSVLDDKLTGAVESDVDSIDKPGDARFIEFLPSGNARAPGSAARRLIYVATSGSLGNDSKVIHTSRAKGIAANWAQVNVDTLTGRAQVYRP